MGVGGGGGVGFVGGWGGGGWGGEFLDHIPYLWGYMCMDIFWDYMYTQHILPPLAPFPSFLSQ